MVFDPNPLEIFSAAIFQKFFATFNPPLKKIVASQCCRFKLQQNNGNFL
jgi:hypothetical protein